MLATATLGAITLGSCTGDGPTAPGESGNWKRGTSAHAITVGNLTRSYSLHVPPKAPRGTGGTVLPYPLVIVLHGSSGSAASIETVSRMDDVADSASFLVAYPNATGGQFNVYASNWNAGTCCGGANKEGVDDIAFLRDLIKHVSSHVAVNAKRVYVAGFSAGALMAYHAGCQLSATVAAIGVVAGSVADGDCRPAKAVSLWAAHGTSDDEVAFDEPSATPPPFAVLPVARALPPAVQFWSALEKCTGGVRRAMTLDVTLTTFSGCGNGAGIEFNVITGGTHGWPGGAIEPGSVPPMNELKASSAMWTFFAKHLRN